MAITLRALQQSAALADVRGLERAQARTLHHLSSGERVARAADDVVGAGVALKLGVRRASVEVAARNGGQAMGMVDLADSAAAGVQTLLVRLRALSVQGSTELLSPEARDLLQEEATSTVAQVDTLAAGARWGDVSLADASRTLRVQVSLDGAASHDIDLVFVALDSVALGLDAVDLRTAVDAQGSIGVVDDAIDTVNGARARFGAFQQRLDTALDVLATMGQALDGARSRVRDADFGAEVAALARHQIMTAAALSVATQAGRLPQDVLTLLRGGGSKPPATGSRSPRARETAAPRARIVSTTPLTPRATVTPRSAGGTRDASCRSSGPGGWRSLYDQDAAAYPRDARGSAPCEDPDGAGFVSLTVSLARTAPHEG